MKKWIDLTDQEKIEMTQVIAKFMDILDLTSLDPVGDAFKDAYFGAVNESLDKGVDKILRRTKDEEK